MGDSKLDLLQGTLDLMVLQTLAAMGALHGYGIAVRIQQVSADLLKLNQGTLYPALLRLEQRGWISSKWGVSENNRKAKYYSLTRAGRKQLVKTPDPLHIGIIAGWIQHFCVAHNIIGDDHRARAGELQSRG